MASECCTNPGLQAEHTAQGQIKDVGGVNTYVTGSGKSVVIYFADVFGMESINAQHVADQIADSGFTVYMPDQFNGGALQPDVSDLWGMLPGWLKIHGPPHCIEVVKPALAEVLKRHSGQKVQLIGFCFGAKPITVLLEQYGIADRVSGVVFSHPSFLEKQEADKWPNVPLHINEAENDSIFTDELREHWEKTLSAKNLITFEKFPGTEHGFSVRPTDEKSRTAAKRAIGGLIQFLQKHQTRHLQSHL